MLKTPLSTVIGGAFWTPGATVIGGGALNFEKLIAKLFANNEQGFAYDPNDLSTMFQDAAGTVPVTGAGQPVGLMLDKIKGLTLGTELVVNGDFSDGLIGWTAFAESGTTVSVVNGTLRQQVISGDAHSFAASFGEISTNIGKTYLITGDVTEISVGASSAKLYIGSEMGNGRDGFVPSALNVAGSMRGIFTAKASTYYITLENFGAGDSYACFDNISVKELLGNHAPQTTSSMRPLLAAAPQRLDYDDVDDNLITNLPTQLTGCTVIRSAPNVGTQILTNQTIPTSYNDNIDHCGLIVINRALTPSETSAIATEFNKRAGV